MMTELTQAILDNLKANGVDVREIAFSDLTGGSGQLNLTRPACNIIIQRADSEKVGVGIYKVMLTVTCLLVVPHLGGGYSGDGKRREATYKLIEAITDLLVYQKLDLQLENPLVPKGFRNITTREFAQAKINLYSLDFSCSYETEFNDPLEKDFGLLKKIVAEYWLEPEETNAEPPQEESVMVTA